jgi:hypothetical protein
MVEAAARQLQLAELAALVGDNRFALSGVR